MAVCREKTGSFGLADRDCHFENATSTHLDGSLSSVNAHHPADMGMRTFRSVTLLDLTIWAEARAGGNVAASKKDRIII